MAISFKSVNGGSGYSTLVVFKVSQAIINSAKSYGVVVDQSTIGTFVVKYGHIVYGSVSIKGQTISLAKAGNLGPASIEAIKGQFEAALTKAIKVAEVAGPAGPTVDIGVQGPAELDGFPFPQKGKPLKPTKGAGFWDKVMGAGKPTPANASLLTPVDLKDATMVYQPVKGTTSGSVYYVLAVMDNLNVAARINGESLSLRAEGSGLVDYAGPLDMLGMELKGTKYASVHFEVDSTALMKKTLGAVIGALGFNNIKDVADLVSFIEAQA